MSDMSQGPGWWIASDGKWYPPHLHPSVRSAEPSTLEAASGVDAAGDTSDLSVSDLPVSDVQVSDVPESNVTVSGVSGHAPISGDPGAGARPGHKKKRRRGPLAAVLSMAVVALLVVGAVVVFGNSKSASAEVIDAVNSTLGSKTAHVTLNTSIKGDSKTITGSGSGGMDFTHNAAQFNLTIGVDGEQIPITADYIGGVIYEKVPDLGQLTPGKSWVSIDLSTLQNQSTSDPSAEGLGNDPSVMLHVLAQQGNTVVPLGPSTQDGVVVNGYAVTVNAAAVEKQVKRANLPAWMQKTLIGAHLHSITLKVFIDGSNQLRSFEMVQSKSTTATGSVSVNETLKFSDYGTPVDVTAPPADQVEGFEQFLQAVAAQGNASS